MSVNFKEDIESYLSSNKKLKEIKSNKEIIELKSKKNWFGICPSEFGNTMRSDIYEKIPIENVIMGWEISGGFIIFDEVNFCITNGMDGTGPLVPIEKFEKIEIKRDGVLSDSVFFNGKCIGKFNRQSIEPFKELKNELLDKVVSKKILLEQQKIEEELKLKREKERILNEKREKSRISLLNKTKSFIFKNIDKDGNGTVDVIEGNDFEELLKNNQKKIIEIDRNYVQKFVRVTNYLKFKKENIQKVYDLLKDSPDKQSLEKYLEVLENDINSYNLLVLGSLTMIVSLVEDDMLQFYDIYEKFDNLNIFDSKHEKDISENLENVNVNILHLTNKISEVGNTINNSLKDLTQITLQTQNNIIKQLQGVKSKLNFGNFLKGVQIYQNHRILGKLK